LRWHAGLDDISMPVSVPKTHSLAQCTSVQTIDVARLRASVDDVVDVLSRINHEINGSVPSEASEGDTNLPRTLVYAITEILDLLNKSSRFQNKTEDKQLVNHLKRTIEIGWSAVLAGDIDDIKGHIAMEERIQ
jgi:hypothetical protein